MASLQFEGAFEELSDQQLQFIRNVLDKRGFVNNKVVFAPVGAVGDNYAANVKRITVEVENGENFQLIAKIAPTEEAVRGIVSSGVIFNNEVVMYREILPKFRELQEVAGVSDEDKLKFPECYGANEEPHEVILLEDLKVRGFAMLDKHVSLPNEAVKLILKNFAILHSSSFALKKNDPDLFNHYKSLLVDLWTLTIDVPEYVAFIKQMEDSLLTLFENEEERYKKMIKGALTSMPKLTQRLNSADANSKHLVIQQGDAWTNNLMFRVQDEEIKECIMIDYQISKATIPVCDILYMIFGCTDYETRSKHFYEWLDYYHSQLDEALNNFGLKAAYAYPRDQLDADIKRYSKMYYGSSLVVLTIILRKAEEAAKVKEAFGESIEKIGNNMSADTLGAETRDSLKIRIKGVIDSCIDFGFLGS